MCEHVSVWVDGWAGGRVGGWVCVFVSGVVAC